MPAIISVLFSLGFHFWQFTIFMMPIVNLGSGISTTVAQSYGSENEERIKEIFKAGILVSVTVSLFLTMIVIPTGGKIIALFGAGYAVKIGSAFFSAYCLFLSCLWLSDCIPKLS